MQLGHEDVLIDKIYEASFMTERWPELLDDLCSLSETDKAALLATDGYGVGGWICNEAMQDAMRIFIEEGWIERSTQSKRAIERREARFLNDHDLFSDEEMAESDQYNNFLLPTGLRWGTGTAIVSPSKDILIFTLHRGVEKGPIARNLVDRLTDLRPHLARSALTSARLRLEQARAAVQALNAMGLPACAITTHGKFRVGNSLFEALVPHLIEDRRDRLHFRGREADTIFATELNRWKGQLSGRTGKTFPLKAVEGLPPHIVHLIPIAGDNRDIFSSAQWILVIVPVELSARLDFTLLEGLFDLTASEAAIAGSIVGGKTLQDIAEDRSVSIETVRTQLKSILHKTGTNRQAELVGLLSNARS